MQWLEIYLNLQDILFKAKSTLEYCKIKAVE